MDTVETRISNTLQEVVNENDGIEPVAAALRYTNKMLYYILRRERFPDVKHLDRLYRSSPDNSLTKRITFRLLCAIPPEACPAPPAETPAQESE